MQSQFNDAFGQSFAMVDPTLLDLVNQARISATSGPNLEPRRDICSGDAFASSMRLDQIVSTFHPTYLQLLPLCHHARPSSCVQITSCIFAMVQKSCGDKADGDVSFSIEMERTQFKLPLVRCGACPKFPFHARLVNVLTNVRLVFQV